VQLRTLTTKYEKLKATETGSPKSRALQQEVQEDCAGLEYMLSEIDKSVDAAERNPQRFRLTQAELSERRKWIISTRKKVEAIAEGRLPTRREDDAGAAANSRLLGPSTGATSASSASGKLAAAVQEENDSFIRSEGEQQAQLLAQQDADLDVLSHHVVRIGELGREMGQELDSQGQLLDELGTEMDVTSTRLAAAHKKVQYVLDRAGSKGQLCIIIVLVVVLVVLIFLAIA
jgi:syntaxin of plants SYP6